MNPGVDIFFKYNTFITFNQQSYENIHFCFRPDCIFDSKLSILHPSASTFGIETISCSASSEYAIPIKKGTFSKLGGTPQKAVAVKPPPE